MRSEHLATPEALDSFLRSFEECNLDKSEWTHGAHVAAAGAYLFDSPGFAIEPCCR